MFNQHTDALPHRWTQRRYDGATVDLNEPDWNEAVSLERGRNRWGAWEERRVVNRIAKKERRKAAKKRWRRFKKTFAGWDDLVDIP